MHIIANMPLMRYRFLSSALTSVSYTQLTLQNHGLKQVRHVMCLFTPQFLLVPIAPTHRGMARLSRPKWVWLD